MTADLCPREDELLDALGRGFVGAELTAHVDECASCGEIRLIAGGLLDVRGDAVHHAPVPSAGTMLWRMHMRKRHDAQAAARRTLLVGQAVTLAVALTLTLSLFGANLVAGAREALASLPSLRIGTPLLLAIAMTALLAPLAGWAVVRQK